MIATTTDIWTAKNQLSFLAVTAHFYYQVSISSLQQLESRLINAKGTSCVETLSWTSFLCRWITTGNTSRNSFIRC